MIEASLMRSPAGYLVEYGKLLDWFSNKTNGQRYTKRSIGDSVAAIGGNYQYSKIPMSTPFGQMVGSPFKASQFYRTDSIIGRVIQHCFPDSKSLSFNIEKNLLVAVETISFTGSTSLTGLARNGYSSLSGNGTYAVTQTFIYYDPTLGKIMKYDPRYDKNVEFDFA